MNQSRIMSNIKSFPHHQQQQQDMSYQQQKHYSVYRPAYHRIPSTSTIHRQSKDVWASMSPEISPIVVPSMSIQNYYQTYPQAYYPTVHRQVTNYQQYQPIIMHRVPIHHTLENATITYDTIEHDLQKDLVKDVFFSPAMITDHGREMSPSECSSSSTCDYESDMASTPTFTSFSPHESPSELLLDDHLFDFGLDLATTSATCNQTTTSSYEEVKMAAKKKKPSFTLGGLKPFDFNNDLPTPPSVHSDSDYFLQTKRRCSDSVLQNRVNKKQRTSRVFTATSPVSPHMFSTVNETLFETDYFDDASGVESEDDQRSLMEHNRFDNLTSVSEYQLQSLNEDIFSTTSWDEEEEEALYSDSASEEDEDFKAPVKYTPKKNKKTHSVKHADISQPVIEDDMPQAPSRPTAYPTIYQKLTKANVDWCRYCGTTEGVNWRPGPWGKRTLCNKHGCDYKGYGFACKLPRLDLTAFTRETIDERERPVLQLYCSGCQRKDSWEGNVLVRCEGCPKAYHQNCCTNSGELNDEFVASEEAWFCDASCCENARRKRIVVELPRKRLPLMCAPRSSSSSASSVSSESSMRVRTLRESSISSR